MTAVAAVVALLSSLLPVLEQLGAGSIIQNIVTTLVAILPDVVNAGEEIYNEVKNIIGAVKNSSSVTPEQFQTLEAAEANLDSEFEAAAVAAGAAPESSN